MPIYEFAISVVGLDPRNDDHLDEVAVATRGDGEVIHTGDTVLVAFQRRGRGASRTMLGAVDDLAGIPGVIAVRQYLLWDPEVLAKKGRSSDV